MTVPVQNRLQKCRSDTFALMLREDQNILHKYDGNPIAHGADET